MQPPFSVKIDAINDLAVITVPEGGEKPYFINGHCYIRQGASFVLLDREELREFFQMENLVQFDRKPNSDFDIRKDFNERAFLLFKEKTRMSSELKNEHILRNLNLLTNGKINNAGVLFFCRDLKKFFLNGGVVTVLYKTPNKADVMDIKEFYDDFVTNYENENLYLLNEPLNKQNTQI